MNNVIYILRNIVEKQCKPNPEAQFKNSIKNNLKPIMGLIKEVQKV